MQIYRLPKVIFSFVSLGIVMLLLVACASSAPVQEMSNARQSLKAATDANAEIYATSLLAEAKQRLESATRELEVGEYDRARILALEAKHLALKARQVAVSKKAD
jgi:predicted S18 family serine protease